jgi:hypothetical protein
MQQESIVFSDKERFILSYYRDARLSSWRRSALLHGAWIVVSCAFLFVSWLQHDIAWGAVAYLVLLWRAVTSVWRAGDYVVDFRFMIW